MSPREHGSLPRRALIGFARFWWEFLVGDTPELFIGTVVVIAAIALLVHIQAPTAVLVVLFPILVALLLITTVVRGRRHS